MATTTTNFGWDIPQSTDLVKDGATAIAALGQDIDTAFVDLKGGTTGQVLAKASNTDLDYSWVAADDTNAIQNTIVDAKGDLISATGSDVPARLAVGSNGETLVADSSTSTGLRYTAGNPIPNPIINSCLDIWQRGTSFTATSGYVADRWYYAQFGGGGGITITRQATGDTTNLPNVQYSMRIQRNSGSTTTNAPQWAQSIETINAIPFAGKTVTFSFYARAGANFSATSSLLNLNLLTGTGTDQNILSTGFTGQSIPINTSATLTTTWQRFTYTATLASTVTEIAAYFNYSPTGTASTNDWVEMTGIQIDISSVALPIRRTGTSIQAELAACQRYFNRLVNKKAVYFGVGAATSATFAQFAIPYPTMRTTPALTVSAVTDFLMTVAAGSGTGAISAINLNSASNEQFAKIEVTCGSGLVSGNATTLLSQNTNATFDLSAEL
jgi:hypothetical protein